MSTLISSAGTCLLAVRTLLFLSIAIASIQNLTNALAYSSRGLLAWPFIKYAYQSKFVEARIFDKVFGQKGFIALNITRILAIAAAAATASATATANTTEKIALTTLLLLHSAIYIRSFLTMTAADQLNTILLAYLVIAAWFPKTANLCCCGIAIQTLFCYFANGLIKAIEPRWTSGIHLKGILLTENYSRKTIKKLAEKQNLKTLSRVVIAWELAAVIAPFLPKPLLYAYLAIGIGFHATIALVMGLNTFFWSFLATYPAILYLNQRL